MLTLAQELGVEDLQNSCEEHVTSTMSVLNACTFLAAAMDIQDRASSKYQHYKMFTFNTIFHTSIILKYLQMFFYADFNVHIN